MASLKEFSPDRNAVVAGIIAAVCVIKSIGFVSATIRQSTAVSSLEWYEWGVSGLLWVTYLTLVLNWNGINRLLVILLLSNSLLLVARREADLGVDAARLALYVQAGLWVSTAILSVWVMKVADRKTARSETQ
jgi:hypothetical protein